MKTFNLKQKVGLMWEKTPYNGEGMLKVGTIVDLPPYADGLYKVVGVNLNEPTKMYEFYAVEMVDILSSALNGDSL